MIWRPSVAFQLTQGSSLETMNIYAKGRSVSAKEYQNGEVELRVETASRTNEQSETGAQKWVYTLAKGDAEADEKLSDTCAEANLSDEPYDSSMAGTPL